MTMTAVRAVETGEQGAILEVRNVAFAYGGAWALEGCSFAINGGNATAIIGPNGAGKSTLVEVLSGFLTPKRGSVIFEGRDITRHGPAKTARAGIIRTFQTPRLLPALPVIENVMIGAMGQSGENPWRAVFCSRGWSREERALREEARSLLSWLGLDAKLEEPAKTLSGGQRRLVEIARALMAHPKLLLLDEPSAGVFPETWLLIAERVRDVVALGVTVILIAHNMSFVQRVTDDTIVMAQGKVLTRGSLEAVRSHEQVVAAYLGNSPRLGS
jgi:ABC-type branched-subunit amino acid transport system ATPase component